MSLADLKKKLAEKANPTTPKATGKRAAAKTTTKAEGGTGGGKRGRKPNVHIETSVDKISEIFGELQSHIGSTEEHLTKFIEGTKTKSKDARLALKSVIDTSKLLRNHVQAMRNSL